ncbi:MAG: SUMF1/EgtB/PvdO family nonheme iron enzyme [Planctomycetota bacterium]|nr:SUMF1/EgtB/PvdO family nonheme iron enzyme [Planctomycetota bacterium]
MDKRNELLFGMIALQAGLVNEKQVVESVDRWLRHGSRGLASILVEQGYITAGKKIEISALVKEVLAEHNGSVEEVFSTLGLTRNLNDTLIRKISKACAESDRPTELLGLATSIATAQPTGQRPPIMVTRAPAEKYSLKSQLGEGGLGTVIMATDNDIGRPVAIKFIRRGVSPGFVERFQRESIITGRLEHPNIIPVYDVGAMDIPDPASMSGLGGQGGTGPGASSAPPPGNGSRAEDTKGMKGRGEKDAPQSRLYMAMKLVRGRDLNAILAAILAGDRETTRRWSPRRLVEAFHSICNAIAYAHSKGVIHRDLKPSNVMVGEFGEVLVVDWGLARVQGEKDIHERSLAQNPAFHGSAVLSSDSRASSSSSRDTWHHTVEGAVIGTPQYMPPEQALGRISELDERSDIYSLGAILYEILTLCKPFEGQSSVEILRKVVAGEIMSPAKRIEAERETYRRLMRSETTASKSGPAPALPEDDALSACPEALRRRNIPAELEEICMRCLRKNKEDRYSTAVGLADEIAAYLEGVKERERRHELAESAVVQGRDFIKAYFRLKENLDAEKKRALEASGKLKPHMPMPEKRKLWAIEDRAIAAERSIVLCLNDAIGKFMEAIGHEPDNKEARKGLCELYWDRFIAAENRGDEMDATYYAGLLLAYGREWYIGRLKGNGILTVRTGGYECDCLQLARAKPAADNAASPASGPERPGAAGAGSAGGPITPAGLHVEFRTEEMGDCTWAGDRVKDRERLWIPRILQSGGTRYGHTPSCCIRDLDGVDVWIFVYEEIDRILLPRFPTALATLIGGDKSPDTVARSGWDPGADRSLSKDAPLTPQASSGLYLGKTPLGPMSLPPGSYLLLLQKEGYMPLRYPVFIRHENRIERVIAMYRPEDCPTGFVQVPGGEYLHGWTQGSTGELHPRELPDFFVARFPVTCAEYLEFLNDLARSDLEKARRHAPRASEQAAPYWEPDEAGVFHLPPPGEKKLPGGGVTQDWQLQWPVVCVSWFDALAYCEWKSAKDGRLYLLPTEGHWEKSARGTDGRKYPFGKHCDPTFCNMNSSFPDGNRLVTIEEFTLDESPYGVCGLGGNKKEWCLNDGGPPLRNWRIMRGGSWSNDSYGCQSWVRLGTDPHTVRASLGFRLISPCFAID